MPDKISSEIFDNDEIFDEMAEPSEPLGTSELGFDEALKRALKIVARDFASDEQPDFSSVKYAVLWRGTYVTKVATLWSIRSRNTGAHKYNNLVLASLRHTKSRGWEFETERKITLDDKTGDDAIERLFNFLAVLPQITTAGKFLVINSENIDSRIGEVLAAVSNSNHIVDLISQILSWVNSDRNASNGLIKLASDDPERSKSLVAALNYGRYSRALAKLRGMLDEPLPERAYQKFLEENHWMFGSEYSELITDRTLVLGQQLDFPLRRTVDGYLDIIEIKTPLNGKPLFDYDRDHDSLYESRDLSKAIGQVEKYLAGLEGEQQRIELKKKLKVEKVRAKLVIGRDSEDEGQIAALRRHNSGNTRVEVITFDQLMQIAERILEIMAAENPILAQMQVEVPDEPEDFEEARPFTDIPF